MVINNITIHHRGSGIMDKPRAPLRIPTFIRLTNQHHISRIHQRTAELNTNIRGAVYPTSNHDILLILNKQLDGEEMEEVALKLINKVKSKKGLKFFVI